MSWAKNKQVQRLDLYQGVFSCSCNVIHIIHWRIPDSILTLSRSLKNEYMSILDLALFLYSVMSGAGLFHLLREIRDMQESVRSLMFLVGAYYFLQGMSGNPGLHKQALKKFLTGEQGFGAGELAFFQNIIMIPWMIKPLYGFIADTLPIRGYRIKSYFILGSILAVCAYGAISLMPASLVSIGVLLCVAGVGVASSDVLCDKLMVIKGQKWQAVDLFQASQWCAISIAGVIVLFFGGYIAQYISLPNAALLSLLFVIPVIPLTLFGWKEDRVVSVGDAAQRAWLGFKSACMSQQLWGCAVFLFFFNLSQQFESAFFVYREKELGLSQIAIGHIDTVGQFGYTLGTVLFFFMCRKFSREAILKGIVLTAVGTTLAYAFVDSQWSAFVIVFCTSFVGIIASLGPLNLAAEACPKDAEGTVFALLMSLINISRSLSDYLGGLLYDRFGFLWLIVIFSFLAAISWFFLPLVREKKS